METTGNGSLLAKILTWTIIGVVAIVAIKAALWLLGLVMGVLSATVGLLGLLLAIALPLALIAGLGWVAVKAVRAFRKSPTTY